MSYSLDRHGYFGEARVLDDVNGIHCKENRALVEQ